MVQASDDVSNLQAVREAVRTLASALERLESWLPAEIDKDPTATAAVKPFMDVAVALETARTAQRAANSLTYYWGAEAMDRGAPPQTLDWSDGTSS